MHRKLCTGALILGQGGKNGSILIIRYHNSRRPLSHLRYIAGIRNDQAHRRLFVPEGGVSARHAFLFLLLRYGNYLAVLKRDITWQMEP